jgi:hypothetical protein
VTNNREEVGPDELLSRHIFHPPMFPGGELLATAFFEFPDNQCESVIWHRHVVDGLDGVHRMGCERQTLARERQASQGKDPNKTYMGAATTRSGEICAYRNPHGHGVRVVHVPAEGRHHVHLCYDSAPGSPPMDRGDKSEIKLKLVEIFKDLSLHDCPLAPTSRA